MWFLDFVFYTFCVIVLFQVLYYFLILGKFSYYKSEKKLPKKIAVSVLICAKNEAQNLLDFLPTIINQEYPEFEIVLINDASTDHTLDVMQAFAESHSNIKIVDVKSNDTFIANKKYALTLGIKASKYDFLLFTDADCKAISKNWISTMSSSFTNNKTIVLGYGAYSKIKSSFLNKLIRFETLLTATQYFSLAIIGSPFMGVGRNLAYRKVEFFNVKGFMNHMTVNSGDDDLFINQVANKKNTTISVQKKSFTISKPKTKLKDWLTQKRRHITTAHYYQTKHKLLLGLFYSSQLLFFLLAILLLISLYEWPIVLILIGLRMLSHILILGRAAKTLDENDLTPWFPVLEPFLVSIQLTIFIANLISKPNNWK